jgi:flagellar basal-body rod modification protein FlgD
MSTSPIGSAASALLGSSSSSSNTSSNTSSSSSSNGLDTVDISQFMQMMITELQNQDPLNPMQNSQIMDELGQMQQISASNKLTTTLDGVALGQSLSNATSLLGKTIDGIDDNGDPATGVVQKVSVANSVAKLQVGAQIVSLSNVQDILPN